MTSQAGNSEPESRAGIGRICKWCQELSGKLCLHSRSSICGTFEAVKVQVSVNRAELSENLIRVENSRNSRPSWKVTRLNFSTHGTVLRYIFARLLRHFWDWWMPYSFFAGKSSPEAMKSLARRTCFSPTIPAQLLTSLTKLVWSNRALFLFAPHSPSLSHTIHEPTTTLLVFSFSPI